MQGESLRWLGISLGVACVYIQTKEFLIEILFLLLVIQLDSIYIAHL